ncbi:2TM domain-containing protein [Synechococcus sp. RS9916]|uniref:2TM domain-containing protein n=1 Tax=Synechococcus sp. RS9916 TaxID=221359 RepID=UPI0000E53CAD|nr:2TM domain-containing protein [Synechococcus sp. RS9916]EAU73374.1 hypothetical protein RS9916_27724 [Synechococcus sp. RS9916]
MQGDQQRRDEAKARVKRRRGLQKQVQAYVIVNLTLVVIWLLDGRGDFWPIWPIGGWGMTLLIQAWSINHPEQPISDQEIDAELQRRN